MSKQLAKANTPPFLPLTPSPFLPPSSVLTHSIDPECVVHRGVQAARGSICAARTNERGTWTGKEVTEGGRGRASIAARGGRKGEEKGMKSCCGVGFSRYGRKHKRG